MNIASDKIRRMALPFSYIFFIACILLVPLLKLQTLLFAVLLAYFALNKLKNFGNKLLAIILFGLIVILFCWGLIFFVKEAQASIPSIVEHAIPTVHDWLAKYQIELSFTDYAGLKMLIKDMAHAQLSMLGKIVSGVTMQLVFLIISSVVAISIFLNPLSELDRLPGSEAQNIYSLYFDEIIKRFAALYHSFSTVMGAQITISAINTFLTMIFVLAAGLDYAIIIIGVTFLFGLIPIIGNVMSNTVIVFIGMTHSPQMALLTLAFLVLIHKLEYFLNSRIIGSKIRNPMWLMLIGLVIGERFMGLIGMVLAPVLLYYIKTEAASIKLKSDAAAKSGSPEKQ